MQKQSNRQMTKNSEKFIKKLFYLKNKNKNEEKYREFNTFSIF